VTKPNFFILGAPKCGTTSLADWLREHPNAFMSSPKEPFHFNADVGYRATPDPVQYRALFSAAGRDHLAIGEASSAYLWSRQAVPDILRFSPGAKFIVMLRFPPEMAVSLHAQECGGREDVRDFASAWRLQEERAKGRNLPTFCDTPDLYQYRERCSVGSQLERLYLHAAQDQVLIIFLEDLAAQPREQWQRVLAFLGLPEYYPALEAQNRRRRVRSFPFKKVLTGIGYAKRLLGISESYGLVAPLHRLNTEYEAKPQDLEALPQDIRTDMAAYFADEIGKVEKLVGRIPDAWRER
jgi:hypothetical protein